MFFPLLPLPLPLFLTSASFTFFAQFSCVLDIEILELEQVCFHWSSNIFGEKYLVKNRLISTLFKVIYFKGTIFQGSTKPLFTL
jgi:hypothetical protein